MRILLLGATGRTGRLVLEKALAAGHQVVAVVRDPAKVDAPGAELVAGTPYDPEVVDRATPGCDAVVCTLNVSRTSDSPWAPLRSPKDLISRSVGNALAAMERHGVRRIVTLSTIGAGDSRRELPLVFALFVAASNLRHAFRDHGRQEALLRASDVDWTVVRLPMLTDEGGEGPVRVRLDHETKLNRSVNRASVARFLLDSLEAPRYARRVVTISS